MFPENQALLHQERTCRKRAVRSNYNRKACLQVPDDDATRERMTITSIAALRNYPIPNKGPLFIAPTKVSVREPAIITAGNGSRNANSQGSSTCVRGTFAEIDR